MDEQEIIAVEDYEEPATSDTLEPEIEIEEPQPSETEEQEGLNTDWGIKDDGEVEFSDEYLGEVEQNLFPKRSPDEPAEDFESEQSKYYTPEELANTPYEQWDVNRLHGNIKDFVPIVQQQLAARQAQAQAIQRQQANQLSNYIQAPVQYSPKELAEAAQKLAIERLGLSDPEDFDEYEGEHRAALNLAMQELSSQRQAEVMNYQRAAGEYQQLQNFNRQLEAQPDFKEFYSWYTDKLKIKNLTPKQVDAGLWDYVVNKGGRFTDIAEIMGKWYREFQQSKATRPRAQKPPLLESSRGNSYDGAGSVNLRNFGDMDMDSQARALIKMGVV